MYESLRCIVLRTVRYDDRRSIVTVWSDRRGRLSLWSPEGSGREARRRRALTHPLGTMECEVDFKSGRSILTARDVRPIVVASSTATDPAKSIVAMFLAELLEHVLRDGAPDEALTAFLIESAATLDSLGNRVATANFPVIFMWQLSRFLGIRPDITTWRPGRILDLRDGIFRDSAADHGRCLDPECSRIAAMTGRAGFAAGSRLRMPRGLRRTILDTILSYYAMHHPAVASMKSTAVVSQIF